MPAVAVAGENAFGVGRVIARTWRRHVLVFSLLTLVAYLPLLAVMVLGGWSVPGVTAPNPNPFDPAGAAAATPSLPPGFWLAYLLTMLLFLVEVGAITHGVIHHLAGKRVSLGAMIAAGLRRSPMLGTVTGQVVNVVFGTLLWIAPGVIYHDLRVAKEGTETGQLASVFE